MLRPVQKNLMGIIVLMLLGGCAHPEMMTPGMPGQEVESRLGAPHAKVALPEGGERWVYSFQGNGQEVWWILLDQEGEVRGHAQVLDREHFAMIRPGVSTKEDVWNLFGKSAKRCYFPGLRETAWMYRFEDTGRFDMACWIQFDRQGVVTAVNYTIDPRDRDGKLFHLP